MFKLLVVEDEIMIKEKILNNINWKENGFIEVFDASDGVEALEIIKNNNIDVLITDIQMPKMNGIELIRQSKGFNKSIKTVIITAFAEFEYAKESVKLNVNDYILKPFRSKDLLEIVKKLAEEIIRERNEHFEMENLRKKLRENKKVLQDKFFNDLLSNSYIGNIDKDIKYLDLLRMQGVEYFIAVVNINNLIDLIKYDDDERKYICNLTLFNWVTKYLAGKNNKIQDYYVINYKIDQIVIVFYGNTDIVTLLLEELISNGSMELGYKLTIGTGNKYRNLIDMYISYREACSAAMLSCIHGNGIVYSFNDINLDNKVYSKQLYILVDTKLYDDIKIGDFEEIKHDIVEIITQIKGSRIGLDAVNTVIYNIMLLSCKTINELGYNVFDIMGDTFNLYFDIKEITDLAQLEEWMLDFFYRINEFINSKRSSKNKCLISNIKDYIDSYYFDNITLTSISRTFGISSGYLSVIFSEYVGQNFIDYLSNLRIQKAKSYLKNSDLRIYEIADKVGYRDAYYFSSAFKKIVGINPTEYREKLSML